MTNDYTGWYSIGETWQLFIDGELTDVFVDTIEIRTKEDNIDNPRFGVRHYDRMGNIIADLTLDCDDIAGYRTVETIERPDYAGN